MLRFLFMVFLFCWATELSAQNNLPSKSGTASYYHQKFEGKKTATGHTFSNKGMTAASNHYKLGTRIRVTNLANNSSVIVVVNDRMAPSNKRLVDVTQSAAKQLCFFENGLCKVKIEVVDDKDEIVTDPNITMLDSIILKPRE